MLCHPLRPNQSRPLGFSWHETWKGRAAVLPADEFLVSSHLVPTSGGTAEVLGTMRFGTLNGFMRNRPSYVFSEEFAEFWRPEARRMTLVRLHGVVQRAREAGLPLPEQLPLIAIKEVNGSHGADVVMSLFPRSKMIFLVRDGRDVVDSLAAANRPDGFLRVKQDTNVEWMREQCQRWTARMDICTRAFEDHDPELRRQVRYEELRADTPGTLTGLLEWLDLPAGESRVGNIVGRHAFEAVPASKKGPGKHRRSATPGSWRQGLTPDEQAMAEAIMGTRLARLGYETHGRGSP